VVYNAMQNPLLETHQLEKKVTAHGIDKYKLC